MITSSTTHQQTKRVVDPVAGTYQAVLTIDPAVNQCDIFGSYNCTVENTRGRDSRGVVIPGNGELIPCVSSVGQNQIVGTYNCTVKNARGRSSITVVETSES